MVQCRSVSGSILAALSRISLSMVRSIRASISARFSAVALFSSTACSSRARLRRSFRRIASASPREIIDPCRILSCHDVPPNVELSRSRRRLSADEARERRTSQHHRKQRRRRLGRPFLECQPDKRAGQSDPTRRGMQLAQRRKRASRKGVSRATCSLARANGAAQWRASPPARLLTDGQLARPLEQGS